MHLIALKTEAVSTSEASVYLYDTIRRSIPEGYFHTHCRYNVVCR